MILIDTHSHIYEDDFSDDRDAVISRLLSNNVKKVLLPNIDTESLNKMLSLESQDTTLFSSMIGLHPTSVKEDFDSQLQTLFDSTSHHNYCAIGEIGLDFYWDRTFEKEQIIAFEKQVDWAIQMNLPLALHVRKALPETIACLKKFDKSKLHGVFHSFSGSYEMSQEIARLGDFYYGINGVVTFKNAGVAEVVQKLPLERILLETDCPYLTPVPYRGKRNETSYILYVAEKIASVKDLPLEEIANQTTQNAKTLFNITTIKE